MNMEERREELLSNTKAINVIKELYGIETVVDIAKKVGLSPYYVTYIITALQIKRNKRTAEDYVSKSDIAFLKENYNKMSFKKLVAKVGVSTNTIYKIADEIGLPKKKNIHDPENRKVLEFKDYLIKNSKTKSLAEMGKELGYTRERIRQMLVLLGIKHENKKRGRKKASK